MIKDIMQAASIKLNNPMEARILLVHATGHSQEYLIGHSDENLSTQMINKFYELIDRRIKKEPIAYIVGYKEFYGRNFFVDKNVLIPRSDSEVLVDAVLSSFNGDKLNILDLGAGTGCLLLTLLLEMPNVKGTAVDVSNEALEITKKNMLEYKLENRCRLIQSNWFENLVGKYDIIISNPPYISEKDINIMSEETLLYEPKTALFAQNNGYAAYEIIAKNLKNFLKSQGVLFIEIGINQESEIEKIFNKYGYSVTRQYKDLAEIVRVLSIRFTSNQ